MQRQWRSKPSKDLIKLFEESVDIKLYLIQERGPLSFLFLDEIKHKFSVTIGDIISCTCGGGRIEHCVHTIYVLNRIFKINFNDPLILQMGFTDPELGKMIEMRNNSSKTEGKKNRGKNKNLEDETINISEHTNRMNLYEDQTCPICQEDMYNIEGLFYCSKSCGHNFHLNCLKVWAEHKKATSDLISCPMCRAEWDEDEIKKMLIKHMGERKVNMVKIIPHRGVNCNVCSRVNIKGERFHCLNCKNFDICVECFNLNKHDTSHIYLMKKRVDDKWVGIEMLGSTCSYNVKNIKLAQFLISMLKDFDKKNNNEEEILHNNNENEEEILHNNENEDNNFNSNENADADADENENEHSGQNNITPVITTNNKCIVCKSDRVSSLQLLKFKVLPVCKHLVHFKCAENLFKIINENNLNTGNGNSKPNNNNLQIDSNFNLCKFDKSEIFPGLTSLNFKAISNNTSNIANPEAKNSSDTQINKILKTVKSTQNRIQDDFLIIKSLTHKGGVNMNPNMVNLQINMNNINNMSMKPKSTTPLNKLIQRNGILNNNNTNISNISNNLNNFALNIEKVNFVTQVDDYFTQRENENKNRIKNMRKLYSVRPNINRRKVLSSIPRQEEQNVNFLVENNIKKLFNEFANGDIFINDTHKDTQLEKMKNNNNNNDNNTGNKKGVKVVDLRLKGLKVNNNFNYFSYHL